MPIGDEIYVVHATRHNHRPDENTPKRYIICEVFHPIKGFVGLSRHAIPLGQSLPHSSGWECKINDNHILMDTGAFIIPNDMPSYYKKIFCINQDRIKVLSDSLSKPREKLSNDRNTYVFGTYHVSMKKPMVMVCKDSNTNKKIWQLRLSAYLYTEVEEQNSRLFFGTAGKGGRFYCVGLKNGETIYNMDTKGTVHYGHRNNYIYLKNRLGYLTAINGDSGEVL